MLLSCLLLDMMTSSKHCLVFSSDKPFCTCSRCLFFQPHTLHVVPPVMVMFAKHPKVSEYDLSSVKSIICGAAPLSGEIEEAVKIRMNLETIHQGKYAFEDDVRFLRFSILHAFFVYSRFRSRYFEQFKLRARVGRPQTSSSPPVILLLAVPRRLFCSGSLVVLDVVFHISVYIGPSPREREKEKRNDRREKKCPNTPTRTYCKRSRPLPYSNPN